MRPQPSNKNRKNKRFQPAYGSQLPKVLKEELKENEQDNRKFNNKFTVKVVDRKELRKQKRAEKGQRRNQSQQKKRHMTEEPVIPNKKQRQEDKKVEKVEKVEKKSAPTTNDAMKRLSKSNPSLYKILEADKLVKGNTETMTEDDRDIAYWESKLGLDKKKNKKLGKEFEQDGLLDILGNIEGSDQDDDLEYLRKKRERKAKETKTEKMENKAEKNIDNLFSGLETDEASDSDEEALDSDEEALDSDEEALDSDKEALDSDKEALDSDEEALDSDKEALDSDEENKKDLKEFAVTEIRKEAPKSSPLTKYVPPHLRKPATTKSEQQIKLQKHIQGQLNRLTESNLESILMEIEKCYGSYPRHDVTSTLTELIIISISQKSNLLDSFVIIYATIVASIYRLIGIEFAAHFVQTAVELFEKEHKKSLLVDIDEASEDSPDGHKETRNLLTLILELYNFQVISCVLVYDLVRVLIADLTESNVELLLRILRTAGAQMRSDDPTSLKHIIDEIQKKTAESDPSTISIRHKFMLETIANIKNNKIKSNQTASGHGDQEMVTKMKKFLNGLSKKRTVRSTEALRVSLDDIQNVDTKGKWWLVGASWKDNLVGTESKYAVNKMPEDLKKDQSLQESLLKLARKQGMNTDIRRTIFITIMSAEDYLDAFEKLMKLGLSEVQQREICRVMLQCTGNEKTFNPFYMLVSKRLCEVDHSFKVTFQYCLWDFLRECGETEVGGLERTATENDLDENEDKNIPLSKLMNMAKFYAALIADGALTLAVLKTVNFMTVKRNARIFLEILFSNLLLQLHAGGAQAVATVFGKILEMKTLAQGCIFFMMETTTHGRHSGMNHEEIKKVQWACKLAREVLSHK
ncbi:hypothetical protein BDB01DRAFT_847232 [Pilobolus umbonatus]|nr:hypothetical protein BDB01DRAFT_847232 [Pilobolus umbonatus]